MDTKSMIKDFIVSELVQDANHKNLGDTDALIESGIIDSLGIMKLIGFLEDKMAIEIEDDELTPENFSTLEAITTLAAGKLAKQ